MNPVLIVLIAGALGSGKTTILLPLAMRLREEGRRVGILENDAGTVPVDAPFLRERGFAVEELRSGCICCNLGTLLPGAIEAIRNAVNPEILLVEPSGLAAPGILREALDGLLQSGDRLVSIYLMDMFRYAQNKRPLSPFFIKSMESSELILASKNKLAPEGTLSRFRNEVLGAISVPSPGFRIEDSLFIDSWDFKTLSKLTDIRKAAWKPENERPSPKQLKPVVKHFSAEYTLHWKQKISAAESLIKLTAFISNIRNLITSTAGCRIGTVKMSTPAGKGTIISVSDSVSPPSVNFQNPWEAAPDCITLNVLVYGYTESLKMAVQSSLESIEELIGIEEK